MTIVQQPQDLTARQLELEQESVTLGVERYRREVESKDSSETAPGRRMLAQAIAPVSAAIAAFIAQAREGGAGRRHSAVAYLEAFDPDVLAYISCWVCLNSLVPGAARIQYVSDTIAMAVEDQVNYARMKEQHAGLWHHLQKVLKKSTSAKHRRGVLNHANEVRDIEKFSFPADRRPHIAMKLIELFVEATGMAELFHDRKRKNKTELYLRGTPTLMEWLGKAHDSMAHFSPLLMPMLVKPRPWTGVKDGGYLTDIGGRMSLVRTRNKAYLRELGNADMPLVYAALNAVQDTAWKINGAILDVMREAWAAGGRIGGLPDRELIELPAKPQALVEMGDAFGVEHPEEFKAWKRSRACVYEDNARSVSKRLAAAQKLSLAEKFRDDAAIYFPHNLDFRGRCYPLPPMLNPQGDDQAKGLLHFAEGHALGEDGAFWLAVHLANTFGVDKVSFEERVAWVRENEELILDSALEPLDGRRLWETADSPWCALAACMEWAGYKLSGPGYVSHLPIALDGSCNGLQNFSAMLRDEVGGAATNLMPRDKPADIYTEVMQVAQRKLKALAEQGDAAAVRWDGRLSRKLVKQPVMTLPYGVTKSGMRSQLLDAMKKLDLGDSWEDAEYLAALLWECIGEVVIAARAAMDWLKAAAKIAAASDNPVSWTTPAGFPVIQEYREEIGRRVNVVMGGRELNITVAYDGTKLDRRRQALGISPNFIHSCDAAHLMQTVVIAQDNGLSAFAMVHDSFGTHAANAGTLAAALRHAFVEQYTPDVLSEFRDELAAQLPPESAIELPPLPPMGDLELTSVLDSRYFFA